jgi:hypothetical protein
MKKHVFGAVIALLALTACTDTDTEPTNPQNQEMSLTKTITYFPTWENYTTRNVKHYENNQIVSDSTYDGSGNFISRAVHTYVNSIGYTIEIKDTDDVTTATIAENYDDQGRLAEYHGPNGRYIYIYDGNVITVQYWDPSDAFFDVGTFTLNSDGYITAQTVLFGDVITSASSLVFNGTKPVTLMGQGTTGPIEQIGSFTYYPNEVPATLQKSTTEINNAVLRANVLEGAAMFSNYYLQDFTLGNVSAYHSDIVFHPVSGQENYPQTQNITLGGQQASFIRYYFE